MSALEGLDDSRTVNETVYRRIREFVLAGGVPIGARLDERALSEQLAVSRTPVRDAIAKLASEGLVDYRPHQGSFVRRLTVKEVNDLYVLRQELEGLAVRLAMTHATPAFVAELREIVEGSEEALSRRDLVAFAAHDHRMHELFASRSQNAALVDVLARIDSLIRMARNLANQHPGLPETTDQERHVLLRAVEESDVEAAVKSMRQHIESVRIALIEELEDPRSGEAGRPPA